MDDKNIPMPPMAPVPAPDPVPLPTPIPAPTEIPPAETPPAETPPADTRTLGDLGLADAAAPMAVVTAPTSEQLDAFRPPPPIIASPLAPPMDFDTPRPATAMGDRSVMGGLVVGTPTEVPVPVVDVTAPPPEPKKFEELSLKTQFEIKTGFESAHPGETFDPKSWGVQEDRRPSIPTIYGEGAKPGDPALVEPKMPDVEPDFGKLSAKTRSEMEAGRELVNRRQVDYEKVVQREKERAAVKLGEGAAPDASNLDYVGR